MKPELSENDSLNHKIAARRAARLSTTPESAKRLFERCWVGKTSPRSSIKAFCLECVGFERLAVTECAAYACPLWNLRPFQKKIGGDVE